METRLFKEKPMKVLLAIKEGGNEWHLSKLARMTGTTYVFVTGLVHYFSKIGLVKLKDKGDKLKVAELTEKGLEIANLIEGIMERAK